MNQESPFKFLDSYTKDDRDIFFGRDLEIEEVYNKVFQAKTLFVYGESGTGKSSLINCGLANKFNETDWLPVYVRRGNRIDQSLLNELDRLSITPVTNLNGSFEKNLFRFTRSLYLDYFKPIYFIFDQFEELFLMGNRDEWQEFIKGIKSLTKRDLQAHFIFIIRAEYLHYMAEFEEELPFIFSNKLRIEKITRLKARECVEGPCKVAGIEIEEGFIDQLFDQLSPGRNQVELTYLQVFLDQVYKRAKEQSNGTVVFSKKLLDDIGQVSDVLSDFLEAQVESLPDKDSTLAILKSFVTIEGTKRQASVDDILEFSELLGKKIPSDLAQSRVQSFLEKRILTELPDQGKYELRHDALAYKIQEMITIREKELIEVRQFLDYGLSEFKKRKFLLTADDLNYINPHLEVLNLSGELKEFVDESFKSVGKKKRFRNRIIGIISVIILLAATSVWGFFYAQNQERQALEQKALAEQSAQEAQKQQDMAEKSALLALQSQQQAETSANEAQEQAQIASEQQQLADQQRQAAQRSQLEAEQQRQIALLEKDSADKARLQALNFSQQAILERERAEKLSMQNLARSLGVKAVQLSDPDQKSLLALQAYIFNQQFDGYAYQADVYNGLYQANKSSQGEDFNMVQVHRAAVIEIVNADNQIFTAASDGDIFKWNEQFSDPQKLTNTDMINNTMAVSPDGSKIAVGTASSTVFVYAANGDVISRYQNHQGEVWKLLFINDQYLVSSGEDKKILKTDLTNGTVEELLIAEANPYALSLNHQKGKLIAGLENGDLYEITLHTNESKRVHRSNNRITELALFHDDHSSLAIGFETGGIILMNPDTYEVLETLPGHTARISDLKFSSKGRFLISGGFDRKNLVWNLNNIQEQPITITDHDSFVSAVGYSDSGRQLVIGELNGTLKLYHLNMERYAGNICDGISRDLTSKEWNSLVGEDIPYQKTCNKK